MLVNTESHSRTNLRETRLEMKNKQTKKPVNDIVVLIPAREDFSLIWHTKPGKGEEKRGRGRGNKSDTNTNLVQHRCRQKGKETVIISPLADLGRQQQLEGKEI